MAAAVSHRLATSVATHAWNGDGTMLAISPNSDEIWIYVNCQEKTTSKWEKKYTLANVSALMSLACWLIICHSS